MVLQRWRALARRAEFLACSRWTGEQNERGSVAANLSREQGLLVSETLLIRIVERAPAVRVVVEIAEVGFGIVGDPPQLRRAEGANPLPGWTDQVAQLVKARGAGRNVVVLREAQNPP